MFEGTRPAIPDAIREVGVVAIGRRLAGGSVAAVADGLVAGGVRAFELTLNEPEADVLASIAELARRFPESELLVGAGTVLSVAAAERAIDAGARFLVSPHLDVELVRWAADRGIPCFPGAPDTDRGPGGVARRCRGREAVPRVGGRSCAGARAARARCRTSRCCPRGA